MNLKLKRTPGIYVVGFMASGKSTIGRLLAQRLGWNFFDIDEEIEAAEKSGHRGDLRHARRGGIPPHRNRGRSSSRPPDRARQPAVLALGGGAFAAPANRDLLENNGVTVWLDCPFEVVRAGWRWLRTGRWRAIPGSSPRCTTRGARRTPWRTCAFPSRATTGRRRGSHSVHPSNPMSNRILRKHARTIFQAALSAADPAGAVERYLKRRDFSRFRNIYVVGAGKAGASMAQAAERVLGRRIAAGLLNVKYGYTAKLRRIELNECGHPVPDENGVAGAERIARIAAGAGRTTW
jgi:hypothetical protein